MEKLIKEKVDEIYALAISKLYPKGIITNREEKRTKICISDYFLGVKNGDKINTVASDMINGIDKTETWLHKKKKEGYDYHLPRASTFLNPKNKMGFAFVKTKL